MRKRTGTTLNCFSPPVMVATIIIELTAAAYTVWRYKLNELGKLITVTLVCLAGFQLAEFNVCTDSLGGGSGWSRLGFAAITVLPPLGVHLMHVLTGKKAGKLVAAAYATMVVYIALFLLWPGAFSNHECTGNYVIFHIGPAKLGGTYWFYYFGWIFTGMGMGARAIDRLKRASKIDAQQIKNIYTLIIGWLVFIVPAAVANIIDPKTVQGIPSIMCGFAVIFALILIFYILPNAGQKKLDNTAK